MTVDRRVRKTRDAIYAAFASLVVERGYDQMTVEDVLEAADIARSTFYAHFPGKSAVLQFGFDRLANELGPTEQPGLDFVEPLLRHARAHAGLYNALLRSGGGSQAEHAFLDVVMRRLPPGDVLTRAMAGGALVAGLKTWLADGAPGDGGAIAERVRRLLEP